MVKNCSFILPLKTKSLLAPADEHVDDEMLVFREDDDQQGVEVEPLHQQPEEVGHDEILEKHQAGFTPHLMDTHRNIKRCRSEVGVHIKLLLNVITNVSFVSVVGPLHGHSVCTDFQHRDFVIIQQMCSLN